jgi:hypothetical protein
LSQDGETVATSALAENAWRPDLANWSGTGVIVAATSTFGIVKAANNEPRFDHDPITLACKGLLIEESRTNIILQSQTFQTTWTAAALNTTGIPAYINVATAPDGTTTAEKLIATITTSTHQFRQSVTLVSGTTYTVSNYFKAAEQKFVSFQLFGVANGNTDWLAFFDVSTATPAAGAFNGFTSISITDAGNGWFRCTGTFTATASGTLEVRIGGAGSLSAGGQFYTGDAVSGFFIWGAQVEAGSFPTSYIPTVAASVVRSADVCSITGSDFTGFWNRFAGTCVVGVGSSLGSVPRFVSNAGSARTLEIYGTTNIDFFEAAGAQEIRVVTSPTYPIKLGLAYAINDYQSSYNGLLGGSDTNTGGTIPNATALHIGNLGGTSNRLTGHIQSIRYFKKRLANAKLASFTV